MGRPNLNRLLDVRPPRQPRTAPTVSPSGQENPLKLFNSRPYPLVIDADGTTVPGLTAVTVKPGPEVDALVGLGYLVEVPSSPRKPAPAPSGADTGKES
jgi:hypothetical protein